MKKSIAYLLAFMCILGVIGCSQNKPEPTVINTFEATPASLVEEYSKNSKEITTNTYYEMSDNTWKTDEYTYKYKLKITGKLSNAAKDTTFIILSNKDSITFEQAWKASGLSSNMNDYFKVEDSIIVGIS